MEGGAIKPHEQTNVQDPEAVGEANKGTEGTEGEADPAPTTGCANSATSRPT